MDNEDDDTYLAADLGDNSIDTDVFYTTYLCLYINSSATIATLIE